MNRYEVTESRLWRNKRTGQGVSIYGALPWRSEAEKAEWEIEHTGWTVRDTRTGTVGYGQPPLPTREDAQAVADKFNART